MEGEFIGTLTGLEEHDSDTNLGNVGAVCVDPASELLYVLGTVARLLCLPPHIRVRDLYATVLCCSDTNRVCVYRLDLTWVRSFEVPTGALSLVFLLVCCLLDLMWVHARLLSDGVE